MKFNITIQVCKSESVFLAMSEREKENNLKTSSIHKKIVDTSSSCDIIVESAIPCNDRNVKLIKITVSKKSYEMCDVKSLFAYFLSVSIFPFIPNIQI